MTISSAFHNAASGLAAASRTARVVSDNLANALTPGYGRRSVSLAANGLSGGVRVVGVERYVDPAVVADRRRADAGFGHASTIATFHDRFQALLGAPDAPDSLTQRIAGFESALIAAESRPDSTLRLDGAVTAAADLAGALARASEGIAQIRSDADRKIAEQIAQLNATLEHVQMLNRRISSATGSGQDTSALLDERQRAVDDINTLVPVRIADRPNGQIALYTEGGAVLLDGAAASFGFDPTRHITAEMTLENGALSGLSVNGKPLDTSSGGQISGGTLGALFEIRDRLGPEAQSDLDAFARDLIERFQSPGLDPTLAPGAAGLFTDGGVAFDPANSPGIAARLRLNPVLTPETGGNSWRLRAGLGAATPGESGDSTLLQAFSAALTERRPAATGNFGTGQFTAGDLGNALLSFSAQRGSRADQTLGFAAAMQSEFTRIEREQGVDSDAELQTLMLVEQAFGANARVIQALDDMMATLLRL